jgi:hypothetical protein
VHDVAVALDEHEAVDLDCAVFADAADVVAAEVDEHHVFCALFFVGEHFGLKREVFGFVGAALAGAGDGAVFDFALLDADEHLGRGASDFQRPDFAGFFLPVRAGVPSGVTRRKNMYGDGLTMRRAR